MKYKYRIKTEKYDEYTTGITVQFRTWWCPFWTTVKTYLYGFAPCTKYFDSVKQAKDWIAQDIKDEAARSITYKKYP